MPECPAQECNFRGLRALQWMQVLQYLIPHQEVMTHIDAGDDNSTPDQDRVRADRVELSQAF
jgi:hypothetical protein